MNKTIKFFISEINKGERLDLFLTNKLEDLTRSYIKKLIEDNKVKINNIVVNSAAKRLKINDYILVNLIKKTSKKLEPKKIRLDIVYEDKDLLIINKQKGMVVHPGAGNFQNTLANALAHRYKKNLSDINGELIQVLFIELMKPVDHWWWQKQLYSFRTWKQFSRHSIKRKDLFDLGYRKVLWTYRNFIQETERTDN